jgi:hypothetical protein
MSNDGNRTTQQLISLERRDEDNMGWPFIKVGGTKRNSVFVRDLFGRMTCQAYSRNSRPTSSSQQPRLLLVASTASLPPRLRLPLRSLDTADVIVQIHFARQLLKRGNAVRRQRVARERIVAPRTDQPFAEDEHRYHHFAVRHVLKLGVVR